ncbi:MAG TPA: Asp-tRNA(Asn)/Glu-tRNA(Gln) amidotransferase subunit GatC [Candidatus Sulfotelmatobacter sp.]|jgi:aspartyl-tRNA(Asn)/glutamyl-tRNA(Gln) amidotransferase subunit C|nr:Asp-tRNA(Asn)/Glu-tRNA(Gln) amidotransferase subunit GatC [Candidatus Sulfotelmatobacter sp.]
MKLDITHIAKLANLSITKEDEKKLEKQLNETLTYIDKLQEVDTEKVQPTAHVTGLENVTREDKPSQSLTQEQALSNTKKYHKGFFVVDAILDNE